MCETEEGVVGIVTGCTRVCIMGFSTALPVIKCLTKCPSKKSKLKKDEPIDADTPCHVIKL